MPSPTPAQVFSIVAWLDRRTRRQVLIGVAVLLGYVALSSSAGIAHVVLDRWWYDSVTDAPVWSRMVGAKVQLAFASAVVAIVFLGSSAYLALRMSRINGEPPGGIFGRYRRRMGPAHRWLLIGIVVVLTFRSAREATHHWQQWLLFRDGSSIGHDAPELGRDLGYYLFDLPFLDVVSTWLRPLLLAALALALAGYLVTGAVRLPIRGARSNSSALAHLGLLGVAFTAIQALDYVFVRQPQFAVDSSGSFVGAGYTALHVGVPATYTLAIVAIVCGFILVNGIRRDRWVLAVGVLAAWLVLHLLLLEVLPAIVQRYVVQPTEGSRELPYLAHNLEATRLAFGLEDVDEVTAAIADGAPQPDAVTGGDVGRIPLFDARDLPAALQILEGTTATRVTDVDLDRYTVDGSIHPVLLGARNPSRDDLPEQGWVQTHLVYTHGDGVVAAPADSTAADGRPDVDALSEMLAPTRPQLYFGENLEDWYAIVGTRRAEQGGGAFDAETGIALDTKWRRAILALGTREFEPFFSAELTAESQLLYRRDVTERLEAIAPFLMFDSDPYPVITASGVTWVVDGYTTSSTYPYAEYATVHGDTVNYAHAAVKATVDAYDGTTHLYRTEIGGTDEPILDAWSRIFPGLIEPISQLPDAFREHLLYPPELLVAQSDLLGRYHVSDVEALFNGTERWTPSSAPISAVGEPVTGPVAPVTHVLPDEQPLAGGHFAAAVPYSPGSAPGTSSARDLLAAIALADHDDPERLHLLAIDRTGGQVVSSPSVAQSAIDADPDLAAELTLLDANGSTVSFGPMTPVIIDDGLVWLRSIIVSGTATTAVPRVYGVVAVSDGIVGVGDDPVSAVAAAGT